MRYNLLTVWNDCRTIFSLIMWRWGSSRDFDDVAVWAGGPPRALFFPAHQKWIQNSPIPNHEIRQAIQKGHVTHHVTMDDDWCGFRMQHFINLINGTFCPIRSKSKFTDLSSGFKNSVFVSAIFENFWDTLYCRAYRIFTYKISNIIVSLWRWNNFEQEFGRKKWPLGGQ